jgi:type II secretory pathway pseudopilin PulG
MKQNSEQGFSYIEVIVAIVILTFGVLEVLSGITGAIVLSRGQQQQLMAKHIATSTLESIMSVKETDPNRMGWTKVGNVGQNLDSAGNPQGIFVTGFNSVTDGAGPDEVIGTADDNGSAVPGFSREIVITDQCDVDRPSANCPTPGTWPVKIRTVKVTVGYFVGGLRRSEQISTVLTDYSVAP